MENGHLWLIYLVKLVIFHSHVSLPEGKTHDSGLCRMANPPNEHCSNPLSFYTGVSRTGFPVNGLEYIVSNY